jgi:hypothetical protein
LSLNKLRVEISSNTSKPPSHSQHEQQQHSQQHSQQQQQHQQHQQHQHQHQQNEMKATFQNKKSPEFLDTLLQQGANHVDELDDIESFEEDNIPSQTHSKQNHIC